MSARFTDPDPARMSAAQRAVHDAIVAGPRGKVVGPLRVWLNSPGLADKAQALGQYARYDSALPPLLSELAILITARFWSSGFEWSHHAPIAARAGLPEAAIAQIAQARRPDLDQPEARAVADFAIELHRDREVSDPTFEAARDLLTEPGVIDLVGVCGYYTLISMTINAFRVPEDGGPPLPRLPIGPEAYFRA